jgi:phosphoserine phosphatase RsbU/P
MATARYAVTDPGLDQMHISLAGHFPPIVAAPGQRAELADVAPGLMIGIAPDARRRVTTLHLAPGTLLCFYTDGLVEQPAETLDEGLARLCQAVAPAAAETACAKVMGAVVGREAARDDIALLMFRRTLL